MTTVATTVSFWAHGACAGLDPELFHPERGESTREARAVCASCAVRVDCLIWALETDAKFGILGGTSERERRRIRRRLAAGLPIAELDPEWTPVDRTGKRHTTTPPLPELSKEDPVKLAVATAPPAAPTNGNPARPVVDLDDDPPAARTAVCVNCGQRYTPKRKDQRFHTKECARAWYATHPKSETGQRQPRTRQPPPTGPSVPVSASPATSPARRNIHPASPAAPMDLHALLGQLLGVCDRWAIEADLGDIRISLAKNCVKGTGSA